MFKLKKVALCKRSKRQAKNNKILQVAKDKLEANCLSQVDKG